MSDFGIGKRGGRLGAGAAGLAVLALLAACGSSGSSAGAATASTASGTSSGMQTRSTSFGDVLADQSGHTIYELVGDTATHHTCTGGCQSIWPPVNVNGTQLVVNGHPAYTFVQDGSAGQVNGQGLRDKWGQWFALDPSGSPITSRGGQSSAPASTSGSSGGGGLYGY